MNILGTTHIIATSISLSAKYQTQFVTQMELCPWKVLLIFRKVPNKVEQSVVCDWNRLHCVGFVAFKVG